MFILRDSKANMQGWCNLWQPLLGLYKYVSYTFCLVRLTFGKERQSRSVAIPRGPTGLSSKLSRNHTFLCVPTLCTPTVSPPPCPLAERVHSAFQDVRWCCIIYTSGYVDTSCASPSVLPSTVAENPPALSVATHVTRIPGDISCC